MPTAAEIDEAIKRDPMSRQCWECDRMFSPLFELNLEADSGRGMARYGGPLVVAPIALRRLFPLFTRAHSNGSSRIPSPPHRQFVDGRWMWGEVAQEAWCSTSCHRTWYARETAD